MNSVDKIRKKINRLQKKGKLRQAIDLQRQICNNEEDNVEEWSRLAELAEQAHLPDLELAARFHVAKLSLVGPDEWLKLAADAETAGFKDDTVDARFQAADAAARMGDCKRAVELCDMVLELNAGHGAAKRIRGIMSARLERIKPTGAAKARGLKQAAERLPSIEPSDDDEWEEESTLSFIGEGASSKLVADKLESIDSDLHDLQTIEEMTKSEWFPTEPNMGSEADPTPARFVCVPQNWPTVLDRHCLMFVGKVEEIDDDVAALAETITLGSDSPVYSQGMTGLLLYCIDSGKVRAHRDRGTEQDFGTITTGSFFGEVGTISGLPCTTSVTTVEPTVLRVITREKLNRQLKDGTPGMEKVVSSLRSWYLETVVGICPLFIHCDQEELQVLIDSSTWAAFSPGDTLAKQAQAGALYVIVMGVARVTLSIRGSTQALGHVSAGDIVGMADPSPVTVTAVGAVSAIALDRDRIDKLPNKVQAEIAAFISECEQALAIGKDSLTVTGEINIAETKPSASEEDDSEEDDSEEGDSEEGDSEEGDSEEGDSEEGDSEEGDSEEGDSEEGDSEEGEDKEEKKVRDSSPKADK